MQTIPGYSRYRVTADGDVYSMMRGKSPRSRPRKLKPFTTPDGYLHLAVFADRDCDPMIARPGREGQLVHILVCLAFHGVRPTARHEVDHIDHNRANNVPGNLRWVTRKENIANSPTHYRHAPGEGHPMAKLSDDDVRAIRARRAEGEILRRIAVDFGISLQTVHHIAARHSWRHVE